MKIAICDDLTEYRLSIRCYTEEYFKFHYIKCDIDEFKTGTDLLNSDSFYDILFLDIELGDTNGIEVAKEIQKRHKNTIILVITAYHQYLDDAMDINVTRYINKPTTQNRIFSALDKAMSILNENILTLHLKDGQIIRLKASDIIYAEAKLKGVFIYTKHDVHRIKETMKQINTMFASSFLAVPHSSYLINLNYIRNFRRNEITLSEPYENIKISIATRKQAEFKRRFLNFIGEDIDNG